MSRPAFTLFAQQYFLALLSQFGTVYLNEPVPRDPKLRVYKHPSRIGWGTEFLSAITADIPGVMVSPEVIGEAELVDVLFEPDVQQSRDQLGILGGLVSVPCIISPLRWLPTEWEMRDCLRHWLAWKSEASGGIIPVNEIPVDKQEREAEGEELDSDEGFEPVDKTLLILVPSIADQGLEGWGAKPSKRSDIPGIYDSPLAFCTTIVAINQLPPDPSTLWLRLLGRGRIQRSAIQELLSLEASHPLRGRIVRQLQQWYQLLLGKQMGQESKLLMQLLSTIQE
jgi:hypothetical protein